MYRLFLRFRRPIFLGLGFVAVASVSYTLQQQLATYKKEVFSNKRSPYSNQVTSLLKKGLVPTYQNSASDSTAISYEGAEKTVSQQTYENAVVYFEKGLEVYMQERGYSHWEDMAEDDLGLGLLWKLAEFSRLAGHVDTSQSWMEKVLSLSNASIQRWSKLTPVKEPHDGLAEPSERESTRDTFPHLYTENHERVQRSKNRIMDGLYFLGQMLLHDKGDKVKSAAYLDAGLRFALHEGIQGASSVHDEPQENPIISISTLGRSRTQMLDLNRVSLLMEALGDVYQSEHRFDAAYPLYYHSLVFHLQATQAAGATRDELQAVHREKNQGLFNFRNLLGVAPTESLDEQLERLECPMERDISLMTQLEVCTYGLGHIEESSNYGEGVESRWAALYSPQLHAILNRELERRKKNGQPLDDFPANLAKDTKYEKVFEELKDVLGESRRAFKENSKSIRSSMLRGDSLDLWMLNVFQEAFAEQKQSKTSSYFQPKPVLTPIETKKMEIIQRRIRLYCLHALQRLQTKEVLQRRTAKLDTSPENAKPLKSPSTLTKKQTTAPPLKELVRMSGDGDLLVAYEALTA